MTNLNKTNNQAQEAAHQAVLARIDALTREELMERFAWTPEGPRHSRVIATLTDTKTTVSGPGDLFAGSSGKSVDTNSIANSPFRVVSGKSTARPYAKKK